MQLVIIIIGKEQKPQIKKTYENRNENTFMEDKLSARTTGRARRAIKKAIIPDYGQKGMGWLHPKKVLYNRAYR